MSTQLLYHIGITLIPGVGDINGKKLIAYCGGSEAVFREKRKNLEKIPGIGGATLHQILNQKVLKRAEQEISFIEKNHITPLFFLDKNYPKRLQHCIDSPIMIYYKGTADLNPQRMLGIVGTRNATSYGKHFCEQLVESLAGLSVIIVSGLAYGIDSYAHRESVKHNIPTIGVLAHGLDRIYPGTNSALSERMLENGGLLSDFISQTNPDKENFPKRNRIVAGMVDAIIVVESAKRGGALITADIANSYNRDVFALPGRIGDRFSEGCNLLIKSNRAAMIEGIADIKYIMRWDESTTKQTKQTKLFREFTTEETAIVDILKANSEASIDEIMVQSKMPSSKIAGLLLNLEFDGMVAALPGKRYKLL
jgi:DNA processing protein